MCVHFDMCLKLHMLARPIANENQPPLTPTLAKQTASDRVHFLPFVFCRNSGGHAAEGKSGVIKDQEAEEGEWRRLS